jgi:hypothetical protein
LATHQAIAAVSQALQGLLDRALPKAAYPTAQVKLLQPADFRDGMADGISLLLYRIGVNTSLRDLPPRAARDGNRMITWPFATVEPVFGNTRGNKRLDRFTLRGQKKVDGQWKLYCLVHNIEKLTHHGYAG